MNRRSFIQAIALAGAAFSILPPALTYTRHWHKPATLYIPNPDYAWAPYELTFIANTLPAILHSRTL